MKLAGPKRFVERPLIIFATLSTRVLFHPGSLSSLAVLDPTHLEAVLASGSLTLTLNAQSEICVLSKAGGVPLPADDIMRVVMIGVQRVREVDALVKAALEKDAKRRIVEVR